MRVDNVAGSICLTLSQGAGAGEETSLARRQRMFLGLARRVLALDAACAALGSGPNPRVIFAANPGQEATDPGTTLAEAIGFIICDVPEAADIGPAQREALQLLPFLLEAGGKAGAAAAAAAAQLARLLVDSDSGAGSGRYCSPRHPTHLEPSILELNDIP
jgi:hypothetical protein